MDLAGHEHRADPGPAVVHGEEVADGDRARLAVDLDDGHVAAEGVDELRRSEEVGRLQPRVEAVGEVIGVGALGDLGEGEAPSGYPLHLVTAVDHRDVPRRRLEHVGRHLAGLLPHLARGPQDGGAADGEAPAPAGAIAHGRVGGVAVAHDDLVEGDAEVVGDDLGEGRLVALAVGGRACERGDRPARLHAHGGALERAEAAHLDVASHADPEEPAVPAGPPRLLLGPEAGVARDVERLPERPVVLARVVGLAGGSLVGEGVGGDEVLPTDLFRREPELGGHEVDQPLEVIAGLRAAGAAVGGHRGRVGEDTRHAEVHVAHAVDPDSHHQGEIGDEGEDRIGADVGGHVHADGGDGPVLEDGRLQIGHLGTAVSGRHHVLDPGLRPSHGDPVDEGDHGEDGVLRVQAELHPEAAADLGGHDADLVLGEAEGDREVAPEDVGRLGRRPDLDASGDGIGGGQARP